MSHSLRRIPIKLDILTLLAFVITARICCAAMSNLPFFTMTFVFLYGLAFIGLYLMTRPKITRLEFSTLAAVGFYTVYCVIQSLLAGKGLFSTEPFQAYVMVFLLFIGIWVSRKPQKLQAALLMLIFLALIFDHCYSIYVLNLDPDASRAAAALGTVERSSYDTLQAVGGFGAVYGGISVILITLYIRKITDKKDIRKWIAILVAILTFVFIVMAGYATAIVLLIFAMALYFGERSKLLSVILILSAVFLLIFHEAVGQWLMDIAPNIRYSEIVSEKTADLGEMIKDFEASGTYDGDKGRWARMRWSWDTFLDHPIFGGYAVKGARIGAHSAFLDNLGRFGIVGFAPLFMMFVFLYKNLMETLKTHEMRSCTRIVFIVYFIVAVLNPAMFSLQVMPLILMLPLAESFRPEEAAPRLEEKD